MPIVSVLWRQRPGRGCLCSFIKGYRGVVSARSQRQSGVQGEKRPCRQARKGKKKGRDTRPFLREDLVLSLWTFYLPIADRLVVV